MDGDDDEVVFVMERTKEEREREARLQAIQIDAASGVTPSQVTAKGSKKRPFPATESALGDDRGSQDDDEEDEGFEARIIRVKTERIKTQTEERFEAERAYEMRTWPDAATAAASALRRGAHNASTVPSPSSAAAAVVEAEIALTAEEVAAGCAEQLPIHGRVLRMEELTATYAARAPAAASLARAPRHLLEVRGSLRRLHETIHGEAQVRTDAVLLRVEARVRPVALQQAGQREGYGDAGGLLPAFVQARARTGQPEANADGKVEGGVALPPRAIRLGKRSLRSLRGMLDAMETEGSAAPPPPAPPGLSEGLCLSEYQYESLGWMLARECSEYAMEDLFETRIADGLVVTSLPGGGITLSNAPRQPRHRGGILAEEMGMGKTMEVLACILSNPPPSTWRAEHTRRRGETLVVVPPVLLGQWKDEIKAKAPGLVCLEWAQYHAAGCRPIPCGGSSQQPSSSGGSGRGRQVQLDAFFRKGPSGNGSAAPEAKPAPIAAVVLATYSDAPAVAKQGFDWWRVVCDEPHGTLLATPRAGRIDTAPAVIACASIDSGRRWCMTGTPFTNSLFDAYGQLAFLGIISASDTGRQGSIGLLPALHFRVQLDGGGRWQATCNDSAEVITSMLKPLIVRHTKAQTRNGQQLLALQPCQFTDEVVEPTSEESKAYATATGLALATRRSGVHRVHESAQALRPMLEAASGLIGTLGERSARMEALGLAAPSLSALETLGRRLSDTKLPIHRDDFRIGAEEVPNDELMLWQASLHLHEELSCVSCLKRLDRAVSPKSCGHLLCRGCADDLLATAADPRDSVSRPSLGIRLSGHNAFPPGCLSPDLEVARAAKHAARQHLVGKVHAALRGQVETDLIEVEVASVYTEQCFATIHLPTAELERLAATELDGTILFDFPNAACMSAGKHWVAHLTCPCPAPGCGKRFASVDILDVHTEVVDHTPGQRWSPIVREFVVAHALRSRQERKAAARARAALTSAESATTAAGAGTAQTTEEAAVAVPDTWRGGSPVPQSSESESDEEELVCDAEELNPPDEHALERGHDAAANDDDDDDENENVRVCDLKRQPVHMALQPPSPPEATTTGAAPPDTSAAPVTANIPAPAPGASAPPSVAPGKLQAVARAVATAAASGERTIVFVDHALLVAATVTAILNATTTRGRPLRAVGVKATTKRDAFEAAKAALAKPLEAGGVDALVMTLRAGAVGHNLTCASRVVFASPCLDTSLRKQAVGRCHRMGQTRPVVVTTLALAGTVEEAALGIMHRDDLTPRISPNGTELRDQEALRLVALEEAVLGPRQ